MTIEELRSEFPQLSETVYGKPLVYLDNAATALRPQSVIDCWDRLSSHKNANIHRAVHHIAYLATEEYEKARDAVRDFIGAEHREEIIFTSGTTHSINLVAFSFGEAFVNAGDEILVDEDSHHSNIVPWQMMCERKAAVLRHFNVNQDIASQLTPKTRLVALSHISNVLGILNPVREIIDICHAAGVPVLVDGAQGIVHEKVDVCALGCDFYAFSGHKIYAATGTGVLYGRKEYLDRMPPYMGGGEMIGSVKWEGTDYAPLPQKFEAGTQNINASPTLVPAIEMIGRMRCPEIDKEQRAIVSFMTERLQAIPGVKIYGLPDDLSKKIPLFSIVAEGAHHEDIALILDKMGIAARSGQMCAEPLMDRNGVTGMLRVSFGPYNTLSEAEYFVTCLEKALKMLR